MFINATKPVDFYGVFLKGNKVVKRAVDHKDEVLKA
jgi:hypothetical protein